MERRVLAPFRKRCPAFSFVAAAPTPTLQRKQIDTRTGLDSLGPSQDAKTLNHVDRIAAGFDKLDKAEALKRHREAFEEK